MNIRAVHEHNLGRANKLWVRSRDLHAPIYSNRFNRRATRRVAQPTPCSQEHGRGESCASQPCHDQPRREGSGGSKKMAGVNHITPGFEIGNDNRSPEDLEPAIASASAAMSGTAGAA